MFWVQGILRSNVVLSNDLMRHMWFLHAPIQHVKLDMKSHILKKLEFLLE